VSNPPQWIANPSCQGTQISFPLSFFATYPAIFFTTGVSGASLAMRHHVASTMIYQRVPYLLNELQKWKAFTK